MKARTVFLSALLLKMINNYESYNKHFYSIHSNSTYAIGGLI